MKLINRLCLWLAIAIVLFNLIACQARFKPAAPYLVQRISDGDTLTVVDPSGSKIRVRFACVDAPEVPHSSQQKQSKLAAVRNQFDWGLKAQARLQQLIEKNGDRVNLLFTDSDRYGRRVAEVRLSDGTLLQEVLAKEGLVLLFRAYLKNCPSAAVVAQAEAEAKQQRRGVWSDRAFKPPWEYRRHANARMRQAKT